MLRKQTPLVSVWWVFALGLLVLILTYLLLHKP
jgi:hypothetical protein